MAKETLPQGEVDALIKEFETKLSRLRNVYEQYFMGMERTPPNHLRKEIVRKAMKLDNLYIRNTASKFRVRSLVQRFNTYKVYWNRTERQIEEGTYIRDIQRARRNEKNRKKKEVVAHQAVGQADDGAFELDWEADLGSINFDDLTTETTKPLQNKPPQEEIIAQKPQAEEEKKPSVNDERAAKLARLKRKIKVDPSKIRGASFDKNARIQAAKAKLQAKSQKMSPNNEDKDARRVFNQLVAAKKSCNESTANLNFESLRDSLAKQKAHLKETRGAKSVDFNVVIKNGKAFLKPELKK